MTTNRQMRDTKLEPVAEEFLATVESGSRCTAANYRQALERFYEVVGPKAATELATGDVSRFVADLNASQLAPGSRAAYVSAVRSFLRYCEEDGVLPKSPLHVLKRPKLERVQVNYLKEPEARRLLEAARPEERVPLALMLGLGLRVSEVVAAQWRHLYEEGDRLGLLVPRAKGGGARTVPVPPQVWSALVEDRTRRRLKAELDRRDRTPIALDRRGTSYSRQGLFKLVQRIARRAGIADDVGPHTLRHSFATTAARGGIPAYELQEALGHSRLETTQFYVHLVNGLKNPTPGLVAKTLFGEDGNGRTSRR